MQASSWPPKGLSSWYINDVFLYLIQNFFLRSHCGGENFLKIGRAPYVQTSYNNTSEWIYTNFSMKYLLGIKTGFTYIFPLDTEVI